MGHDWAKGMEHRPFGMVSYEGRALSTREGYVVYLEDLLNKAVEKARGDHRGEEPEPAPTRTRWRVRSAWARWSFSTLHNDRNKDIDFRWERALNFDGETGPWRSIRTRAAAPCCARRRRSRRPNRITA